MERSSIQIPSRMLRRLSRKQRRWRQQLKRHPERGYLVSGPCNRLKTLAASAYGKSVCS